VQVNLQPLQPTQQRAIPGSLAGTCLDQLDIDCSVYTVMPSLLQVSKERVTETVYSDLLRSNCLVTGQPDWGSIQIEYTGARIQHESLLQYIVSFRNHNEFGEHCIERIYMDLLRQCQPQRLKVVGQYTRRGGIDINCIRATHTELVTSPQAISRLVRQ
jgi:7-cyano-7-deazaguanine reductase